MSESIEEIVARFELVGFLSIADIRALIASWRERGKAIEQMRAYQAQLEERTEANADALQQALYDSMKP